MTKASMQSFELGQARSSTSTIDLCMIASILACAYAMILGPLYDYFSTPTNLQNAAPGVPNRLFWPMMTAVALLLASRNRIRLGKLVVPVHIKCLLAYGAFAGLSVLWAFKPETSFTRYTQQVMVLTSIVLPAILATRTADLMRGLFLCSALASFLNILFVFGNPESVVNTLGGYPGYFLGKNYLGEFATAALILALYETLHRGSRRASGIVAASVAILLLFLGNSKTALGLAAICPILAGITLFIRKITNVSPAIILLSIPCFYIVLSNVSSFNTGRISYILYGDSTFTGRTIIWDFADQEIARSPLVGWGYQCFWLAGSDAPSVVDARGFVKAMPNAHNGYIDTKLELGYVGYALLLTFIISMLHAVARVAERDFARAWLVLSLLLYIVIYNCLESIWMRGFEFLWVVFLMLAAEIARYCQPTPRRPTVPRRRGRSITSTNGVAPAVLLGHNSEHTGQLPPSA